MQPETFGAFHQGQKPITASRQPGGSMLAPLAAVAVLGVLVVVPVINVFWEASAAGLTGYWTNVVTDPDTRAAIYLTLRVASFAVVLNLAFGLSAAWLLARFRFPGKNLLSALIDLPLTVSPVVAGFSLVLVFGAHGFLGPWLQELGVKVIFAEPGLVLATAFVTFPLVARQLIPLLEAIGPDEELAARSLGARGWDLWWQVTLPNLRWGLLYAILLCNARAIGEFGAVAVVSGRITGVTDTLPLRVEKLFQEYNLPGAFAVASLLTFLGVLTLGAKTALERKTRREIEARLQEIDRMTEHARDPLQTHPVPAGGPKPCIGLRHKAGENNHTPGIRIDKVTKRFGQFVALDRVSFDVPDGSLTALLGPSGSGKTTLLRILAGLEVPDEGAVFYGGDDITGQLPHHRNFGFVFQHYALFRHMTVYENVAFGLRVRRWPRERVDERVRELLRLVRLEGLEFKYPCELSGGQRQRVALARALAPEPRVLLLDEPFGALDAKVRRELREWLRRLHDQVGITSVFVTHDQDEAFEVADQVVILNRGNIEQVGTPVHVFNQPANAFVTEFLGHVNVFRGHVCRGLAQVGPFAVHYDEYPHEVPTEATAYVRPHELEVDRLPRGTQSLKAQVLRIHPLGSAVKLDVFALDFGVALRVDLPWDRLNQLGLRAGDTVFVFPKRMRIFVHNYQI